ncbi:MAG: hypothetical protein KAG66_23400, partial [Methylococcales bacterium]|nr:hypothetical protein [Methylococcales bacterium]
MAADNDGCTRDVCRAERCPLHFARQRAEKAHILVVNHSLLLADIASGSLVLPNYHDLIIDEAHHLEPAVTDALSFKADKRFMEMTFEEITKPRAGQIGIVQAAVRGAAPPDVGMAFDAQCEQVREHGVVAVAHMDEFFEAVAWFMKEQSRGRSQYAQQLRLVPAVRTQPHYGDVEIAWENFGRPLPRTAKGLSKLAERFLDIAGNVTIENGEDLAQNLMRLSKSLVETADYINAIISEPGEGWIYWFESFRERLSLHAAPLHVGPLVEEHIFSQKETVILASATLRTAKKGYSAEPGFEYMKNRLQGTHANEMAVGSPF